MPAIVAQGLHKAYGDIRALDGIDLEVQDGEFFGLLGPNGAGKSTLINILATMLPATAGRAQVAGFDVQREPAQVRKQIGIVFQDPCLDEELTGYENLLFHARLYKVSRPDRTQRIEELLKIVELSDRAGDRVKGYSGGMRRRLELIRGLLHHPRVLFLDEPTLGLDPQTRSHIWGYIRRLNAEEKVTMVLTTHYMDEADALCHQIRIIDRGRFVAGGTPNELKAQIGGDLLYLTFEPGADGANDALRRVAGVRNVTPTPQGLQVEVDEGARTMPRVLEAAGAAGARVQSIHLQRPTLEDVFLRHTGRQLREEGMDAARRIRFHHRRRHK